MPFVVGQICSESACIPIWCEDIYYKIALEIDTPTDLLIFAAACKGLRAVTYKLFKQSRIEVCISSKTTDNTSYVDAVNPRAVVYTTDEDYIPIGEWASKLLNNTSHMHGLQKAQYYKNIRSALFVNVYITPTGKKLAFTRCKCGKLTTNRIMFKVAKLQMVYNTDNSRYIHSFWPNASITSRHLILDCQHMCTKCMRGTLIDQTTPIALNNYAKATLSTTLHLNNNKVLIRNGRWRTLIK
jgi:hypothetical protein